jgi:hypothetical protein
MTDRERINALLDEMRILQEENFILTLIVDSIDFVSHKCVCSAAQLEEFSI